MGGLTTTFFWLFVRPIYYGGVNRGERPPCACGYYREVFGLELLDDMFLAQGICPGMIILTLGLPDILWCSYHLAYF